MLKQKTDPFLAQTSVMLVVMLVMYLLGGDHSPVEQLLSTR